MVFIDNSFNRLNFCLFILLALYKTQFEDMNFRNQLYCPDSEFFDGLFEKRQHKQKYDYYCIDDKAENYKCHKRRIIRRKGAEPCKEYYRRITGQHKLIQNKLAEKCRHSVGHRHAEFGEIIHLHRLTAC